MRLFSPLLDAEHSTAKAGKSDNRKRPTRKAAAATAAPRKSGRSVAPQMRLLCSVRPSLPRVFGPNVHEGRTRAINSMADKWVNGTLLHYYFFDKASDGETVTLADGSTQFVTWKGNDAQKKAVRDGFAKWKSLGIGLDFKEVSAPDEAEIRIGFMRGNGSWSWVGREILDIGTDARTMNFGWDIASDIDTVLHEIGHTLGLHHEHQNPFAGIVWNEPLVYSNLAGPPNHWSPEKTHWNIIRKLPESSVQGTQWDPDSVMHYPFETGMILQPEQYSDGLTPAGGLSARDVAWTRQVYPPLGPINSLPELVMLESKPLAIQPGQQIDLRLNPNATRNYEIRTFGVSDTLMVLFEDVNGELRFRAGDDDSGEDRNAYLKQRLYKGRKYVLRVRLYYADRAGETAVMWW
jgi:Astacin (Peptidase family M12A)